MLGVCVKGAGVWGGSGWCRKRGEGGAEGRAGAGGAEVEGVGGGGTASQASQY